MTGARGGGRARPVLLALVGALSSVACDRSASRPPAQAADSGSVPLRPSRPPSARSEPSSWERATGLTLVVPTVDGGMTTGALLRVDAVESTVPDTAGVGAEIGDGSVELFTRGGSAGLARVVVEPGVRDSTGCTQWPLARMLPNGSEMLPSWSVALAPDKVDAVALDSIEGMASRDSAQLAARVAKLASGLPDDTSATFRGLPFVVLRAWRSRGDSALLGPSAPFVVALLVRRVNQEDNPVEERLLLVADLPGGDLRGAVVGWSERAAGREEELVVAEPVLAYRLRGGDGGLRLLFARDDGVAMSAAVLARAPGGGWQVLWESAIAGCP